MTTADDYDPTADARDLVALLLDVGERLPRKLRNDLLALGSAAAPPLIEILKDEDLRTADGPGRGWAPIHAIEILGQLKAAEAVEPMLSAPAETDWLDYLHDALIRALPEIGAPVLEPALRAHASSQNQDFRHSVAAVLPGIGVRDERVFSILLDNLREDPTGGAGLLADYGDSRAIEHLVRAFDEHEVVADGSPFADQALVELREAIERLRGALDPAQEAKFDRACSRGSAGDAASRRAWRPLRPSAR